METLEKQRLTYEDYLAQPDDGKRYQLIDGELIMTPAPGTQHQSILQNLNRIILKYVEQHKLGKVFFAPVDVVFKEHEVYQPDIVYVSKERTQIITKRAIEGVPELIVEILSPSTGYYDLVHKRKVYEERG